MVGRIVGYDVTRTVGKRPASALSRPVQCSQVRLFSCDVQKEPPEFEPLCTF